MCSLLKSNQISEAALKVVEEVKLCDIFYAKIFEVEQFEETYYGCDASSVAQSVGYWVELVHPSTPPSLDNFAAKGLFVGAEFLICDEEGTRFSDEEVKCQAPTAEQIVKNVLLFGVEAELTHDLVKAATVDIVGTSFHAMESAFPRIFEELGARALQVPLKFD